MDAVRKPLTIRETQIVRLVAEGHTVKQIAFMLELSPSTVESHKYNVMQKLGLKSAVAVCLYALRNGIAKL